MNILIGILFLAVGFIGIFCPGFFFKSELLTPEKIQRNKTIWKWVGIGLLVVGSADLFIAFLSKKP
jgi:hypothetical protein